LPNLPDKKRHSKSERYSLYVQRAMEDLENYLGTIEG
jgi:hypothetical protein